MTLPEAIRAARLMHGDGTQNELSAALGHSQSWASKVERGIIEPTARDLAILSHDLGLTLIRGEWGVRAPRIAKSKAAVHA